MGNYLDIVYIWGSVVMVIMHMASDPQEWGSRLVMIVVIFLAARRTFLLLRIFHVFSPIVTMLASVFWDLRIFLTFYGILVTLFGTMFAIVGMRNENLPGGYRDDFLPDFFVGLPRLDPEE